MKEMNVGDKVWWVKYERELIKSTCPICYGKMRVTVILGNGDSIETDCNFCERGYQRYGWIETYGYVSGIVQVEITGKEVREYEGKRTVNYRYGHYTLDETNAFADKTDAENRLVEVIEEKKAEDLGRLEHQKNNLPKKLTWHVGYYQRMKREAEQTIRRCDEKITYFKGKTKAEKLTQMK